MSDLLVRARAARLARQKPPTLITVEVTAAEASQARSALALVPNWGAVQQQMPKRVREVVRAEQQRLTKAGKGIEPFVVLRVA